MRRHKGSSANEDSSAVQNSNSHRKSVTEILKEPLNYSYYEVVADEMAEIVSKHTYNMHVDDDEVPIVVLKPGLTTSNNPATQQSSSSK